MPSEPNKYIPVLLALILISGCLFFFWPLLFWDHQLAYRDASYLYYPLFNFIQGEWERGVIPLWNPHCGLGQPLLADGTSSVYYPGKLIFFANSLSFEQRFGLYIVFHLLFAGSGTYRLSRKIGVSQIGSAIAAIAFTFGAPFLSLVNNIVYLVGGAWLPWALLCLWSIFYGGQSRVNFTVILSICLSMMILGGDAQMAYHVLVIAVLFFICKTWTSDNRNSIRKRLTSGFTSLGLVGLSAFFAFCLSAVQILPTQNALASSSRAILGSQNIFETPWPGGSVSDLRHKSDLYQFSLPPWTMIESVAPNIVGTEYPVNRRWIDHINPYAESNNGNWYPSLYFGLIVLVLAFYCLFSRHEEETNRWRATRRALMAVAFLFCLGSFGIYGPVWLFSTITGIESDSVGPQVGGVYWFFEIALPKYGFFRYPAKLFLVGYFAIALLAAVGWDQVQSSRSHLTIRNVLFVLAALSGIYLFVFWVTSNQVTSWFDSLPADSYLGPFDSIGAQTEILRSLIQLALCSTLFGAIFWLGPHFKRLNPGIVVLLFADLLIANYWIAPTMPMVSLDKAEHRATDSERRYLSADYFNDDRFKNWSKTSSRDRLAEIAQHRIDSLVGKTNLWTRSNTVDSFSSIENYSFALEVAWRDGRYPLVPQTLWIIDGPPDVKATLLQDDSSLVEFIVESTAPCWVLIGQQYDRDWKVYRYDSSGKMSAETLYLHNGIFQAVSVPEGKHTVVLKYQPRSYYVGALVSRVSCFVLGVLILVIVFERYRRRSAIRKGDN